MQSKTILSLLACAALSPYARAQAPVGTVYIESNIGDVPMKNSVLAYHRNADGTLTKFGEFLTKGTGVHPLTPEASVATLNTTLGPFDSDQNLIQSPDGKRLFAVNSGSDTIASFDVHTDGTLVPVRGSPFLSFGKNPVSLGIAGVGSNILIAVNKDYDLGRTGFNVAKRAPNYDAFKIATRGQLVRIPLSTITAEKGGRIGLGYSNPTQALIIPGGALFFDVDFFGYQIHSFHIPVNGRITRAETQFTPVSEIQSFPPLTGKRALPVPLGMAAHPTEPVVYAGLVFDGRAAVYYYNQAGEFVFLRSVAVGSGPCWLRVNAAGDRLYTSNTLANSVSVLDITDPYDPVKLQEFVLQSPADLMNGASPFGINLDPSGQYLYCLTIKALVSQSANANALHVLKLAGDGTVSAQTDRVALPSLPSAPQGITSR